jgi:hypothetical protein
LAEICHFPIVLLCKGIGDGRCIQRQEGGTERFQISIFPHSLSESRTNLNSIT